jgi:hypothetical protein
MELVAAFIDWVADPDNLTAVSTFTIAVFVVALAVVTRRQAMLTKESIRVIERAVLDLERAAVMVTFPEPVERNAAEWYVRITLSNIGRSFGTVRGIFLKIGAPDSLPVKPPKKGFEERAIDMILRPGETWNGLPPIRMPSRQEGQIVYGFIRYEDVFGRLWRRRFAVAVWSDENAGPQPYQPVGGEVYNGEALEE